MIKHFLVAQLLAIQSSSIMIKTKGAVLLGASLSPFTFMVNKLLHWTTTNSEYVTFVLLAIAIDHILGTMIHAFIKRDFSWKENIKGVMIKIAMVLAVGLLFEGINHIVREDSDVKTYLIIMLRLIVFMYPAGSAFANCSIVTNGKFPPISLLKKFTAFQENLNVKELISDDVKETDKSKSNHNTE
jgi:predicted MFS family arabinose efflux permease